MKYEIGNRIRAYRKSVGLSQKEFAAKIGVSNQRVSNWEHGLNRPDADTVPIICAALGISPNDLLNTPSNNQLPSDALEIAKAYSTLTPPGKELVRTVVSFAEKHLAAHSPSVPPDIPLQRIGTVNGVPLFQLPDDMRFPTKEAAREEQKEMIIEAEATIPAE